MKPSLMIAIGKMKPKFGGSPEEEGGENDTSEEVDSGLESAMEELIAAIEQKDAKEAAKAFEAAFDCLEKLPHDEYSHEE